MLKSYIFKILSCLESLLEILIGLELSKQIMHIIDYLFLGTNFSY
jgi:hypothetical protein